MNRPNYIKIHADGIEHLILEGAMEVLMDPALKSLLVEINDAFDESEEGASKSSKVAGSGR